LKLVFGKQLLFLEPIGNVFSFNQLGKMSDKIYPIYYKGHKIYFTDWTNQQTEKDAIAALEETTSFIEKLGEYNLLEVIDVTNSISPPKVLTYLMACAKRAKPFSKRKAFVGVTPTRQFVLHTASIILEDNLRGFDTLEEALEWVTEA